MTSTDQLRVAVPHQNRDDSQPALLESLAPRVLEAIGARVLNV